MFGHSVHFAHIVHPKIEATISSDLNSITIESFAHSVRIVHSKKKLECNVPSTSRKFSISFHKVQVENCSEPEYFGL